MLLRNLVRALPGTLNVHCVCPPGWLADEMVGSGATIHLLENGSRRSTVAWIRRTIQEIQPDVVHLLGPRGGILGAMAADPRRSALVYTELLWTADYAPMLSRARAAFQLFLLRRVAAKMDRLVCVSRTVADFLSRRNIASPETLRIIYPGVELLSPASNVAFPIIGTLGSLNWMKGTDLLLRALPEVVERHPDVVCRIGGRGPRKDSLQKLAKNLAVDGHVEWCGEIRDAQAFLSQLQIYIHPSRNESFGIAPMEAMSVGLPVIVSSAGSLPEIVEEGASGAVFPAGNVAELARMIGDLLANPEKRADLSRRGLARAAQFTEERAATEYVALYNEIVDRSGAPN